MEIITQTSLEVGQECWIEHYKGTFLGEKDGRFVVRVEGKNEVIEKYVSYQPAIDPGWRPEGVYKYGRDFIQFNGTVYCWKRDGGLVFYYGMKSTSVFKNEEIMRRAEIEKLEPAPDDQFSDAEIIDAAIGAIDIKITPLRNQMNDLHTQITNLEKSKEPIYAKCFHDWDKQEEEQYGSNQKNYRQLCTCLNCGKEQYSYYSKF